MIIPVPMAHAAHPAPKETTQAVVHATAMALMTQEAIPALLRQSLNVSMEKCVPYKAWLVSPVCFTIVSASSGVNRESLAKIVFT
ncbi:hypothetical protein ACU6QD_05360 [Corynebacterium glucuronolyticum]